MKGPDEGIGCIIVAGYCVLVIATGFLFHIGWNMLDGM